MRWLILLVAVSACGLAPTKMLGEPCSGSTECVAGLVCYSGTCHQKCDRDSDCPSSCSCSHGALGVDTVGHCTGGSGC